MGSELKIPVSVIVTTLNEAANIRRCLEALCAFDDVIVVDSGSTDGTQALAEAAGAKVIPFAWGGRYPKKRQWCLDTLSLMHEWVFFVDADEVVTPALVEEIRQQFKTPPAEAGFFVRGRYVIGGRALRHGLHNNKLCLLDRRRMMFPVIDDLDLPGMGEIEGHYQPVLKPGYAQDPIGQIRAPLLHHSYEQGWEARHKRYAAWEIAMNRKQSWPADPVRWRQALKQIFRALPGRPVIAFLHCYILKLGFLEGKAGIWFAASRFRYYRMIRS
ncbi:MAG: glycosyltransferase family 2 protein [Rhodospirillales bacterium]|nr:glycosyltransferase family 2 protein [Rhodospirillales bacterium]MCB9996426.1 glycosyltransferase family 2 protein [Rhodospirillales bacterium]